MNWIPEIGIKIGDRIYYKTIGGWYNSGIVKDIDDESCLVEVDKLGCESSDKYVPPLPYYVRILLADGTIELDKGGEQE